MQLVVFKVTLAFGGLHLSNKKTLLFILRQHEVSVLQFSLIYLQNNLQTQAALEKFVYLNLCHSPMTWMQ